MSTIPPEYPDTFVIGHNSDGVPWIECLHCGARSYSLGDIEHHYCARCKMFHDDLWPPARQWWIDNKTASARVLDARVDLLSGYGKAERDTLRLLLRKVFYFAMPLNLGNRVDDLIRASDPELWQAVYAALEAPDIMAEAQASRPKR